MRDTSTLLSACAASLVETAYKTNLVSNDGVEVVETTTGEMGRSMAVHRVILIILISLLCGGLAMGCSDVFASESKELRIGMKEWDENVAISTLTKVLLEDDLGYDNVELQLLEIPELFEGVASGDLDAFQDVWMPNFTKQMDEYSTKVEHLPPWFEGETAYGIAVPTYMKVESLENLDEAGTDIIVGLGPDTLFHRRIAYQVIPAYDLRVKLVESSTPAMLSELDRAYREREPIIFLGWSPHWMNTEYDFRYLRDPKDAQGKFNDSSSLSTIVRKDLKDDDPVAYELIRSISLTESQLNELEAEINEAGDPVRGVNSWLDANRSVVEPWIRAAETTKES